MKKIILLLTIVFSQFLFTACDENVSPTGKHIEAVGMAFYASGIKVAEILRGETSDTLYAPAGGLGDHIEIKFIDENGNEFAVEEDAEQTLAWEFANPSIATIWQHEGEEGSFEFHLQGLLVGTTTVEFFAMHNDHYDYRSGNIPVKIINQSGSHGAPIGAILEDEESGNILARIQDSTVTGQLSIAAGSTSDHIEITLFDANGVEFQPPVPPHSLNIVSGDESKLQIEQASAEEPWAFKLIGVQSGTTTITIQIYHDETLGKQFVPINVNVY